MNKQLEKELNKYLKENNLFMKNKYEAREFVKSLMGNTIKLKFHLKRLLLEIGQKLGLEKLLNKLK